MPPDSEPDLETLRLLGRLSDQEDRLRLALEAADMGTWQHVPATHALIWDARAKAIFGYAADEELGFEPFVAAIAPDDLELVQAGIAKAMDPSGPGQCSLQYRIETKGGERRWVEAHGRCVFEGDVPLRINGTLLDITERKRAEESIREAARRKDEFLAVLGHELRNPLAPIRTALDLMQARAPEQSPRERQIIDRQLRHVTRLVDDLLDLARIARGSLILQREPRHLAAEVQLAVEQASPLFEAKQHRLQVSVPEDLRALIDPVRFAQIVSNLLTNAAKFSPERSLISLRAEARGQEVALEITDSGAGIEAEQLTRIFEPFVQGPRDSAAFGGLGLGLSLVRDLLTLHDGRIEAHSAGLGQGSRFVLYLPLLPAAETEIASAAQASARPAGSRRILIVDDNEDATEMMALLLGIRGHEVRVANDGMSALTIASEFEPEVAVLDLGLPVMDGYELAARLIDAWRARGIRLIAVTGYGQAEDRTRTRAAGFDVHLVKPVSIEELEAALAGDTN